MESDTTIDNGTVAVRQQVTNEEIAAKLDALGTQMDWVVENLASLFSFVQQVSSNGGGIRGLMQMLKAGPPSITQERTVNDG